MQRWQVMTLKKQSLKIQQWKTNNLFKKWVKNWSRHLTKEQIQKISKHMRRGSTSCVIREIQIKTVIRFHCTTIGMARVQNSETSVLARRWRSIRSSHSLLEGMRNGEATLEDILAVSYWRKHTPTYSQAIVLLDISPKELKAYAHTKVHTHTHLQRLNS